MKYIALIKSRNLDQNHHFYSVTAFCNGPQVFKPGSSR